MLDAATGTFYDAWKARYLVNGCAHDRYYVFVNADGQDTGGNRAANSVSVSEGHGYGMMIMALMAGHDPQAKVYFDGLYRFFKDHPSDRSSSLMAWNQIAGCGNAPEGGTASATDGDLDIAYALVLADRQWGSTGTVNYLEEAQAVIAAIKQQEVNPSTSLIQLGDFVDPAEPGFYYGTRPSDFMPDHYRVFQSVTGDIAWRHVLDAGYRLLTWVQTRYSPAAGLVPDFIRDTHAVPRPAEPGYLETRHDGHYSYNACRVPWRLATDYLISGEPRAFEAVQRINAWIRRAAGDDPASIYDGYDLRGVPFSRERAMAFVVPFAVGAMVDPTHQRWLNALWTVIVNTPRDGEEYYGNTLKLLGMIVISGNWWAP